MTEVARLEAVVAGKDVGLSALLTRVESELRATDSASQRTTQETLKLASSYAQLARGLGEPAAGASQLRSTLEGLSSVTSQQELGIRRQIAALDAQAAKLNAVGPAGERAASGLGSLSAAANTVTSALGAIGIGVGIQQLVNFGGEAIELSNKTRTADAALRALAGSPKLYADALATAREQQKLFGGSLEENISGVQGLITVSRSSGVELSKLIDLSQRLSVKDPGQGAAGARIALQEAFSGDPTSLAKRYEIPKAALAKLKDESITASDKLKILDTYLNQIGITSEVASGSIPKSAIAMNELSAGAEAAKVSLGTLLAEGLAPLAAQAGTALQGIAGGLSAFGNIGKQQQQVTAQLVTGAQSYDQYAAANKRANDQIAASNAQFGPFLGVIANATSQLPTLTQAQFALAQAMIAQGTSSQEAALAVQQYSSQIAQLNPQQQALAASLLAQGQGFSQVVATVAPLGTVLAEIGTVQENLVASGQASEQSAAALAARLAELAAVGGPVGATVAALADGFVLGQISADQLSAALAQLEEAQSRVVVVSETNGSATGAQEGATRGYTSAVDDQTKAIGEMLVKEEEAAVQAERLAAAKANVNSLAGQVASGYLSMSAAASVLAAELGIAANEAERLLRAQTGKIVQTRFASQRDESQQRRAGGGPQDASKGALEFVAGEERKAAAATRARERAARLANRTGGGGGIPPAVKLQQDTNNKLEDLERDHQDKMAQIAADGAQKRAVADRAFTRQQLTGRASFYRSLANVEDQATRQQLSARFEAIQAEAAALKQTQGADVAQQYSEAATAALERQAEIEKEIADARDKGDTGQAEYLTGVLELQKAADKDELDNIKNKGSAIAAEQARQYTEQQTAYEEHLNKLGIAFQRKAAQIPGLAGSLPSVPAPPPLPPPATVAAAQAAAQAPPLTGQPTDKVQPVADVATPAAVDAQTGRLEGKLSEVIAAVQQVAARVQSVESAISSLKRSNATAGG